MDIFKSTSQQQHNRDTRMYPFAKGTRLFLATGLIAFSCFGFSPAWASESHSVKPAGIHLTSLSINIGPGGFHIGVGVPSYGRSYGRTHLHRRHAHQPYWKHSRHHHGRHQHYGKPHRFNNRHGWKNDRHRGNFRGKGGRGNSRHRGGRW